MCNRISAFDLEPEYGDYYDYSDYVDFIPQYHVFSFETKYYEPKLSVVLNDGKFHLCDWGIIPEWVKDREQALRIRKGTVQAQAESLVHPAKKSFANALVKKRFCLIPVNGFYDHMDRFGKSYPHFIHLKSRSAFSIAGIYDVWVDPDSGQETTSFAVVTCEPNKLMARVHNGGLRMPVILRKEDEEKWLYHGDQSLLVPYTDDEMDAHPVSKDLTKDINTNKEPSIIERFKYRELDFEQTSLFFL